MSSEDRNARYGESYESYLQENNTGDGNTFDLAACRFADYSLTHPPYTPPNDIPIEMVALCDSCPTWDACKARADRMIADGITVMGVWHGKAYGNGNTKKKVTA